MAAKRPKLDTRKNKPGPKATDWRPAFFEGLREAPLNVAQAAEFAGVSRQAAYDERDKNPEFAAKWEGITEAAMDQLEETARRYALTGDKHESMTLLIFMLKARRRQHYGGVGDGPVSGPTTVIFKDGRDNA